MGGTDLFPDALRHSIDLCLIGNITLVVSHVARLKCHSLFDIEHDDGDAPKSEGLDEDAADPAGSAGDEDDLVGP